MVIIDTTCLFCVAGSNWWVNFKNLLVDVDLRHEIDETREAERYTFCDATVVAGPRGKLVFSVVFSKHLPLLIGRDFLTPARAVRENG